MGFYCIGSHCANQIKDQTKGDRAHFEKESKTALLVGRCKKCKEKKRAFLVERYKKF